MFLSSSDIKLSLEGLSFTISNSLIIEIFSKICSSLPCPDCQQHAKHFVAKTDFNKIKCKRDFIDMIWVFHNIVNKRQGKPTFLYKSLVIYEKSNVSYL